MQRSTSKLLARAGSLRNMNRTGYKFRFTLRPETLDKVHTSSAVALVWQRTTGQSVATPPASVDKDRVARFSDASTLEAEITLFKKRKSGAALSFEDKVYRLAVRADGPDGRAVARIDVNFADYADVPEFSKRVAAVMSHGGRLVMTVASTFVGEAKPKKKRKPKTEPSKKKADANTGNVSGGGSSGVDSASSVDEAWNSETDPDSVEGLTDGLDDDLFALSKPAGKPSSRLNGAGNGVEKPSSASPAGSVDFSAFTNDAMPERERAASTRPHSKNTQTTTASQGGADELSVQRETIERLAAENRALRSSLADAEARLGREPVYKDVVRELREAKMALAILTLEKDELAKELRESKEAAQAGGA